MWEWTQFTGNLLSDPFLKLPSRRRYLYYYREIKNPISLSQIRAKIVREEYANMAELTADLSLMFENAKQYNRPDSKIFKDAVKLHKLMNSKTQQDGFVEEDVRNFFFLEKSKVVSHWVLDVCNDSFLCQQSSRQV